MFAAGYSDWAHVPRDLLNLIAEQLAVPDFIRFRSVCSSWSSATASCVPRGSQHPWLMVPSPDGDLSDSLSFLSIPDSRLIRILNVPEITNQRVFGSHIGWLVTINLQLDVSLFNPLTRALLPLPPLSTYFQVKDLLEKKLTAEEIRSGYISKAIVGGSSDDGNDCIVALIVHCCLTIARPGDKSWSRIEGLDFLCVDAVFLRRKLYVLRREDETYEEVCIFDVDKPRAEPIFLERIHLIFGEGGTYLAVLPKYVIHLTRFLKNTGRNGVGRTRQFIARRFDWKGRRWVLARDLKGMSFFLGREQTFFFSPSDDIPRSRGNYIYYNDDFEGDFTLDMAEVPAPDVGVFDLEKGTCENLYPPDAYLRWPLPAWFTPSLPRARSRFCN